MYQNLNATSTVLKYDIDSLKKTSVSVHVAVARPEFTVMNP